MSAGHAYFNSTNINEEMAVVTALGSRRAHVYEVKSLSIDNSELIINLVRTYNSHPFSFNIGSILVVGNIVNIAAFTYGANYLLHPIISFAALVFGVGILSTMFLANK